MSALASHGSRGLRQQSRPATHVTARPARPPARATARRPACAMAAATAAAPTQRSRSLASHACESPASTDPTPRLVDVALDPLNIRRLRRAGCLVRLQLLGRDCVRGCVGLSPDTGSRDHRTPETRGVWDDMTDFGRNNVCSDSFRDVLTGRLHKACRARKKTNIRKYDIHVHV